MSEFKEIVIICSYIKDRELIENCCENLGWHLRCYRSISEALPFMASDSIEKIFIDKSGLTDYQYDLPRLWSCVNSKAKIIFCFGSPHDFVLPKTPKAKIITENFSITLLLIDLVGENAFRSTSKNTTPSLLHSFPGNSVLVSEIKNFCLNTNDNFNPVLICGSSGSGKRFFSKIINQMDRNNNPFIEISFLELNTIYSREHINASHAFDVILERIKKKNNFCLYLKDFQLLDSFNKIKFLEEFKSFYLKEFQDRKIRVIFSSLDLEAEALVIKYFRSQLNGDVLLIPNLSSRKNEIGLLFEYFLTEFLDGANLPKINQEVYSLLENYKWGKNVRELKQAAALVSINCVNGTIAIQDLPKYLQFESFLVSHTNEMVETTKPLIALEAYYVSEILNSVNGNISKAAKKLGVTRNTIKNKIKKIDVNMSEDISNFLLSV